MAATLEGAFKIRDQASAKLIAMRVEAERTDAAFTKLGLTMDGLSSNTRTRRIQDTSRSVRQLGLDAGNADRRVGSLDRGMRNADRSAGGFGARIGMVRRGLVGFAGDLFRIARPAGMLVGFSTLIGLAGQGVGALAGGLVALTPRVADLASASAAAIPAVVGLVGGFHELAAAGKAVQQGMQGGTAGAQAIRQYGPGLAQVVRHLRSMRGELRGIKQAGTTPIFGAFNQALTLAHQQRGQLRSITGTLGRGAADATSTFARGTLGDPGFMRQIGQLASVGANVFRSFGVSAVNLAHGFVTLGVAARPLTEWLSRTVQGWTAHWAATIKARAASGQLTQTFERSRTALSGMFHFIHNVWVALRQLGRDARPAGEELYRWLSRISDRWASISSSTQRNTRLTREFFGMARNFEAIGNVVGHLAADIFNMGGGRGIGTVANQLDRSLPAITKFFDTMANTFGPPMVALLTTFGQTLGLLTQGTNSPLVTLLESANNILKVFNSLVRAAGPFQGIISHAFEAAVLLRFLTRLKLLEVGWGRVGAAAAAAKVQEREAMMMGPGGGFGIRTGPVLSGLFGGARGRSLRSMRRSYLGGGARFYAPGGAAALGEETLAVDAAQIGRLGGYGARAGLAARLGGASRLPLGLLRGGLGLAGRVALPLTALMGAFGALTAQRSGGFTSQLLQTTYGAVRGVAGGLGAGALGAIGLHDPLTPEQRTQKLIQTSQQFTSQGLRDAGRGTQGIGRLNREIDVLQVTMAGFARDQTDSARQYRTQLSQEIQQRRLLIGEMKAEAQQRAQQRAGDFATALNTVYSNTRGTPAQKRAAATAAGVEAIGRETSRTTQLLEGNTVLGQLRGAQRTATGQTIAGMIPGAVFSGGPNGLLLGGGQSERGKLKSAITLPGTPAQRAEYRRELIANLVASGFARTDATSWVTSWIARGFKGNIVPASVVARAARQRNARAPLPTPNVDAIVGATGGADPTAVRVAVGRAGGPKPFRPTRHLLPTREDLARALGMIAQINPPPPLPRRNPSTFEGYSRWMHAAIPVDLQAAYRAALRRLGAKRAARGLRIPGSGMNDTVPINGLAAPGELIVNRHTERRVNSMLAGHGATLGGMVEGETTPHSAYAKGGRVPFHGHPGARAGIESLAGRVLSTFPGLQVTATTDGNHVNGSYHYKGEAVDLSGNAAVMQAAGAWIGATMGRQLLEGIHNSSLSVKNGRPVAASFWGPSTWAGHLNHIHLAAAGGAPLGRTSGFRAGQAIPRGARSRPGTGTGHPVDVGTTRTARAAALALAAPYSIGRLFSTGPDLTGFGGLSFAGNQADFLSPTTTGAAAAPARTVASARASGGGVVGLIVSGGRARGLDPAALLAVAAQEGLSGGIGDSGHAYGPFQLNNAVGVLAGIKNGAYSQDIQQWAMSQAGVSFALDRIAGVAAGLTGNAAIDRIVRGFEKPANPDREVMRAEAAYPSYKGYSHGGRLARWAGWHADGLDKTFSTPTVIGVGERGSERVTVTPTAKGKSGGGAAPVFHNVFHIASNDPEGVRREIEAALHKFADDLDRYHGTDVAEGNQVF